MSRHPPAAPYPHATHLPQHHDPYQLNHSQGETDISYTAYSPSPSSLSVHRYKWGRIRDWRSHHPTVQVSRHIGSIGSHGPSVGVGSANWSDTGTGLDEEGQTDIGTIPTTVRVDRELRDSTIIPDKRNRVDPKRHIGSQQSNRHTPDPKLYDDPIPSELPYRQSSLRRPDHANTTGLAGSAHRHVSQPVHNGNDLARHPSQSDTVSRPPLVHSKSRSKPTPQTAKPPIASAARSTTQILPAGSPLVTFPEEDFVKRAPGKDSPFAIREAYLNSALTLPLDMLSQIQKDQLVDQPVPVKVVKPAKSQSSISSGLTTGRLASLMGNSRGPSPGGGTKRIVSDGMAIRSGPKVQDRSSKDSKVKVNGDQQTVDPVSPTSFA